MAVSLGDPSTLALLGTFLLLFYVTQLLVRRLILHPLARFPGPKLAAASYWYEIAYDIFTNPQGQYIYHLDRLHDKYGPIIRVNPEEIHVRDSEWFDVLYSGPGSRRDKWDRSNRANGSPYSTSSTTPHDHHRLRRAALNQYFSKRKVTQLEPTLRSKADLLCQKLSEYAQEDKVVDIGAAFTALTLDMITEYCYDECFDCLNSPGFAPEWKQMMSGLFESTPVSKHFPIVPQLMQSLPPAVVRKLAPDMGVFLDAQAAISAQAERIITDYQNGGGEKNHATDDTRKPKTVFHGILDSNLPPEEKTPARLKDEAFVLIVAGAETTSRALTTILAALLSDKELLTRLQAELASVMVDEIPPSIELEKLPFLKAVIQEGLRVSVLVTNRQILIAPDEDLRYAEWKIPRGTPISMGTRDVLLDPSIFPNPKTFDPDRWIRAAKQGVRLDRFLVTFQGKGTRSCVGMNLAMLELYFGTAALIHRFDMRLFDFVKERDLDPVRDTFVGLPSKESRGVRMHLSVRR